ncbi:hypothetical protein F4604DRAFT_1924519 [Suillus subluteus]|nr:hypothetical protein F4604DRAFT_1924519 [Suillus subluteus]
MPALRPRLRRSARLQTLSEIISSRRCRTGPKVMDPPPAPPACGRGKCGRGGRDTTPTISISWQSVPQRTNRLVDHLVGSAPDCRILFASEKRNSANREAEGRLSGKDKNEIHAFIARVVFSDDDQYGPLYASNPNKFRDSVGNRIAALRTKFRDIRAEFESTGAGIVPIDSETSKYEKDFPWYDQLYSIWGSHPSFSAKTSSSKPGVDHAGDLFSLTRPSGGSVCPPASSSADPDSPMQLGYMPLPPNAQAGGVAGSSTGSAYGYPPPSAHAGGAAAAPSASPQFFYSPPAPGGSGGSPSQWNYAPSPPGAHTNSSAGSPVFRFPPLPSGSISHDGAYSPVTPSLNDNYNYDGLYDDNPLADEMEDLHMDGMDEITRDDSNAISLNSPPRPRAGKKRQEPPSPPSPPATSQMPQMSCTSVQNDRSSFKSHVSQVMRREKSKSGSVASSGSRPSSHSSQQPLSQQSSPTAQTSVSTPASSASKCLRTEIRKQIDMLNDDLESMHSDKLTLYQLKNERLMVKLNANRQDKEHDMMREEHLNERSDAAIVHQRMKEAKEVDICLREVDAAALAMEADVLRLRIQWAQLNAPQGGRPAGT